MSNTDPMNFEAIVDGIENELPPDLRDDVLGRSGWNSFVEDFKERQIQMEGFGPHGVVGSEDLKRFQRRLNELDPSHSSDERRFGYIDLIFDAFIVARVDDYGRPSIDLKTLKRDAQNEQIRRAQCAADTFDYEHPAGDAARLLSLKIIDIDSPDKKWFDEYLQDPSSGIYIPAANLLER